MSRKHKYGVFRLCPAKDSLLLSLGHTPLLGHTPFLGPVSAGGRDHAMLSRYFEDSSLGVKKTLLNKMLQVASHLAKHSIYEIVWRKRQPFALLFKR